MLCEDVEPREETIVSSKEVQSRVSGDELDAGLGVRLTADGGRNNVVTVGCEGARESRDRDVAEQIRGAGGEFVCIAVADFVAALKMEMLGGLRKESERA